MAFLAGIKVIVIKTFAIACAFDLFTCAVVSAGWPPRRGRTSGSTACAAEAGGRQDSRKAFRGGAVEARTTRLGESITRRGLAWSAPFVQALQERAQRELSDDGRLAGLELRSQGSAGARFSVERLMAAA